MWELARINIKLARLVAKNSSAPPELLEKLSNGFNIYRWDDEVRRNVVANPNTPTNVLIDFAGAYPNEFLQNPILPLLALENPQFLNSANRQTIIKILENHQIPECVFISLQSYKDADVIRALVNHPQVPKSVLEKVIKNPPQVDNLQELQDIASRHVNYAGEITEGWDRAFLSAMNNIRFIVRDSPREFLLCKLGLIPKKFVNSLLLDVRIRIAGDINTPEDVMQIITDSPDYHNLANDVEYKRAANSQTPPETLIKLAENPNLHISIHQAIAKNLAAPTQALKIQARHPNTAIKAHVLQHPRTALTRSILYSLYRGTSIDKGNYSLSELIRLDGRKPTSADTSVIARICYILFVSSDIPEDIISEIATIEHIAIRIALARYPQTPAKVIRSILTKTKLQPEHESKLYANGKTTIINLIIKHPQLPKSMLFGMLDIENVNIENTLINAAKNHGYFAADIFGKLFLQQLEAAENLDTSSEKLSELATSQWVLIRKAVANHPKVSQEILAFLANDKRVSVCITVAQNPNTSGEILARMVTHKSQHVKLAIASNPRTPWEILENLAMNKGFNPVRQAAIEHILQTYPAHAAKVLIRLVDFSQPSTPRLFLLLNPILPGEYLAKYAKSPSWLERW